MTNILILPLITAAATTSCDGDIFLEFAFASQSSPGAALIPINITGITFSLTWMVSGNQWTPYLRAATDGDYLQSGGQNGVLTLAVSVDVAKNVRVNSYIADLVATADGHTLVVGSLTFNHAQLGFCAVTSVSSVARNTASASVIGYVPGPPGADGAPGATGPAGPQGLQGPQGQPGAAGTVANFAALIATLPTSDPLQAGAPWLNGTFLAISTGPLP